MIQFNHNDISRLIRATRLYQYQTGSEYLFDEYEKLADKLQNYQEQITTD